MFLTWMKCNGAEAERRRILWNVSALGLAFMLEFSAWSGMTNLQSTINRTEGLGVDSLMAVYASLIASNLFLSVTVLRWLGCKWAMVISFIVDIPYTLAQFKPEFYTLIPAAMLTGLGGGPMWCGQCTYLSIVAEAYSKMTNVPTDTLTVRFFGIFFMIFQLSQVLGNLVSSLVLSTGITIDIAADKGQLCGAKFCPRASINPNNTNLSQPSDEKIYSLTGVYLGFTVVAICIVALGVDSLKRYNEDSRQGSATGLSGLQLLFVTMKLLKEPRQLLLIPITMWLGMEQALVDSEYTAAYVSCAWGVRNIGFVMICYGVANAASAASMGLLVKLLGRVRMITGAALITLGLIATLLLWMPTVRYKFVFFVISGLLGIADSIWLVQISAMCGNLFPGREEAAYSNLRLSKAIGSIVAYGYSSTLCTDMKLYILLVVLLVGLLGYYVIEWQLRREAAHSTTDKQ